MQNIWFPVYNLKPKIRKIRQDITEAELVNTLENRNEGKLKELGMQAKWHVENEYYPEKLLDVFGKNWT